jgi:hypothetical protein
MIIYRAAAACGLVLEMAEKCGVHITGVPLGGGPLAQLGVVFGVAFVIAEGQETIARAWHCSLRKLRPLWQGVRRRHDPKDPPGSAK